MRLAPPRKRPSPLAGSFLACALSALPTLAATTDKAPDQVDTLLDALTQVRAPVTVAISPDSNYVAWTVVGKNGSELHLTGRAPTPPQDAAWDRILSPDTIADPTRLTPGKCTAAHPAWSPNGLQLAFLSNCSGTPAAPDASGQENLWIWTAANNSVRQISNLKGSISDLLWSPDGKSIAFLFVENATRKAGALDAMKPWSGVIGEDGLEVQRVYAVNIADGEGFWLTREGLHVYEFSWATNSSQITFVAAEPPGENTWWTAKLYESPIPGHKPPEGMVCATVDHNKPDCPPGAADVVLDPAIVSGPLHGLQIAVPRFSPDGKQIAFIGGLMSDQGSTGGDIYLIPATGLAPNAEPRDLTPNRPASPAWIDWRNDHELLVSEHRGGDTHIALIDTQTGKEDPKIDLTMPAGIIAGFDTMSLSVAQNPTAHNSPTSLSSQPAIAFTRQSFDHPPEVWAGPLDHLTQISHLNDSLHPLWGKSESITWTNESFNLQGWLLYPADYDPAKRYPLIVSVHGGPSSAVTPRWPEAAYGPVPFSNLGYFVFMPNPRGSFGQGEAFTQANRKDFGYGDLRDILAGLDSLEQRLPIDPAREDITGWSYGGFMTMFAVTQTNRFHAAVAGAGIANWLSYYGENSIDQWMVPFFGATVYEAPDTYAHSSPINFIKNVKTPTLVVVGDRDGECPAPQSFEFWHALRAQGVKTQLVVYPNEGHHFISPEHRRDVLRRALEWFQAEGVK